MFVYVRLKIVFATVPPESVPTIDFCPFVPARSRRGMTPLQEKVPSEATDPVHRTLLARFGFFRPDM
jgi:hypothetical protein